MKPEIADPTLIGAAVQKTTSTAPLARCLQTSETEAALARSRIPIQQKRLVRCS